MDLQARRSDPPPPPVEGGRWRERRIVCPRCGRAARLFLEQGLNVYEHRAPDGDETRAVCIVP